MSENVPPSPETNESPGILNVSVQRLNDLLNSDDAALSNSVRRVREDARNKDNYAAFSNAP
jgi:FXSXX-COOH protein